MRSSLRFQIIFRLLVAMFIVILANRYLAKLLVSGDIYSITGREMRVGMLACSHHLGSSTDFLECYENTNRHSITSHLSDALVICGADGKPLLPLDTKACAESKIASVVWFDEPTRALWFEEAAPSLAQQDWLRSTYSQFEWMGVRDRSNASQPLVIVRTKDIEKILEALWQVRDNHLASVLPIILLLIVMVGFWLIRAVLEPVKRLETSIQALTPDSLLASKGINSQYIEFETITAMYRDMCMRLDESFHRVKSFTSNASHELKTPLTILRGTAERLIAELPTGSDVQILARGVADEVERLISISDQLLLLSRADGNALVLQRQEFDLSQFIADLADDAVVFEEGLTIQKNIEAGVVWLCDTVLIRQLIHNLYTNAVKYNVPNGHIDFELRRHSSSFELRVINSSSGVSTQLVEHAFERFYRGDASHTRSVDGLGLGLSICLEIAKCHRGTLGIKSDGDSNVTLTLNAPLRF